MHSILSFSSLGLKKLKSNPDPAKFENYFQKIHGSGDRLLGLLNDLLDISKLEAGKMVLNYERADVSELLCESLSDLDSEARSKELDINLVPVEFDTKVECDKTRLIQVLINLLSNAIKFSPAGGRIDVTLEEASLTLGRRKEDSGALPAIDICIADQGPGVPEEELDVIFDEFTQSSKTNDGSGGTGLGLAISKSIVEAHRGNVWVENGRTGGAQFHVVLPVYSLMLLENNAISLHPIS